MNDLSVDEKVRMTETWVLHYGDCLDPATGLALLPDKSIDVCITDPPYSEHVHESCRSGLTASNKSVRQISEASQISVRKPLGFGHREEELELAFAEQAARVVRRWVAVFTDVESVHNWIGALVSFGLEYVRTLCWHKYGGAPQFTGDRPSVAFECILLAHRPGRKRWNGGGRGGFYESSIVLGQRGEPRLHDTQKPLSLMESLVRDFTDPGELVLDPFAGSGTTGVACIRNGRRFISWEKDPKYHEVAMKRLRGTREQLSLGMPKAPKPKQALLLPDARP